MAAEFLTACALLVGGIGTIKRLPWGQLILLTGLGMMIYSVINSPGYFAHSGDWALMSMFLVLLLLGVFSVFKLMKSESTSRTG